MLHKECNKDCTGRCNKNRKKDADNDKTNNNLNLPKECNIDCTGRCNKNRQKLVTPNYSNLEVKEYKNIDKEVEKTISTDKPKDDQIIKNSNGLLRRANYVIFDLDGIVLDIETVYAHVINEIMTKYSKQDSAAKIIDLQDRATAKYLINAFNLPLTSKQFLIEFRITVIKHLQNCPLMPGVSKLVNNMVSKKIPIAIAATCTRDAFNLKTAPHKGFFSQFNHILLGGSDAELKQPKPSPQIYQLCASRFSDKPEPTDCLVFEDMPEGVTSAINANMAVVWIPNKYMSKELGQSATLIVDSFEAITSDQYNKMLQKM